jgi:hypothetical protein
MTTRAREANEGSEANLTSSPMRSSCRGLPDLPHFPHLPHRVSEAFEGIGGYS